MELIFRNLIRRVWQFGWVFWFRLETSTSFKISSKVYIIFKLLSCFFLLKGNAANNREKLLTFFEWTRVSLTDISMYPVFSGVAYISFNIKSVHNILQLIYYGHGHRHFMILLYKLVDIKQLYNLQNPFPSLVLPLEGHFLAFQPEKKNIKKLHYTTISLMLLKDR